VVNAHGLLKLKNGSEKCGQTILLINERRLKIQQKLHVVRVEPSEEGNSAVAFELIAHATVLAHRFPPTIGGPQR